MLACQARQRSRIHVHASVIACGHDSVHLLVDSAVHQHHNQTFLDNVQYDSAMLVPPLILNTSSIYTVLQPSLTTSCNTANTRKLYSRLRYSSKHDLTGSINGCLGNTLRLPFLPFAPSTQFPHRRRRWRRCFDPHCRLGSRPPPWRALQNYSLLLWTA